MKDGAGAEICVDNEYLLSCGQNLPNHTMSQAGRGKYVAQSIASIPMFRTKQAAFRYAAWLIELADGQLPDELDAASPTFDEVRNAIRNT